MKRLGESRGHESIENNHGVEEGFYRFLKSWHASAKSEV